MGSDMEWMRIEEEPEAESIWFVVVASEKISVGWAVDNQYNSH